MNLGNTKTIDEQIDTAYALAQQLEAVMEELKRSLKRGQHNHLGELFGMIRDGQVADQVTAKANEQAAISEYCGNMTKVCEDAQRVRIGLYHFKNVEFKSAIK